MTTKRKLTDRIIVGGCLAGKTCHDCGVKQGELHEPGCDMELCPRCLGQALSCACGDNARYHDRIPYLVEPNQCALCSVLWPELEMILDEEWERIVPPTLQRKVLCRKCLGSLRKLWALRGRRGWRVPR